MATDTKTAIITGAAGGVGSALARRLDALGYHLTLLSRNAEKLQKLACELSRKPELIVCDFNDEKAFRAARETIAAHEAYDLVLTNAGYVMPSPLAVIDPLELDKQLNVNLRGGMFIIHAALPKMVARGQGMVLANVSMGAIIALQNYSAYSAAKFGMRGFLWALSNELKGTGVKLCGVYSSAVDTPMLRYEATHEHGTPLNFMGKIATADEVAEFALRNLEKPKLESYLPYGDSITSRILLFFPRLLEKVTPMFIKSGIKGREKYLERTGLKRQA
jgi:2-dehydro-3-deoxy-L-rhamnonate dehydrogenase (NAD+)